MTLRHQPAGREGGFIHHPCSSIQRIHSQPFSLTIHSTSLLSTYSRLETQVDPVSSDPTEGHTWKIVPNFRRLRRGTTL